jgi:hypothetical protein
MARPLEVAPPIVTPESFTLLDYVQWVDTTDPHWRLGIMYPVVCGGASTTYDICIQTLSPSASGSNPTKSAQATRDWRGATPFTVYTEIDCSPVGWWDAAEANVREALRRSEAHVVEEAFWTGTVHGDANIALPHLAADTAIFLGESQPTNMVTLQTAASVPVTGTVDVVEGLGILERELSDCYSAQGLIYVTLDVFEELVNELLVFQRNGLWYTAKGNKVVPGGGFTGTSPAGAAAPTGTAWMYATGALMGYRSAPKQVADRTSSLDRSDNTLALIIERTYLLGWDCCHIGVRVSTGGAVTGTANSAT